MMDILLVGAGGFGAHYIDMMHRFLDTGRHRLCAVADPCLDGLAQQPWLLEQGTALYRSPQEFYAGGRKADLAIICSPIQFHAGQAILALENGSAVLCEKPLCATLADAGTVRAARDAARRPLGVGFQWSFSPTMLALKRDILAGRLGQPLRLRTMVSWKRPNAYYQSSSWKGRLYDDAGRPVMDSIAMNATAHYLHNMLFLLGNQMDSAALPQFIEGSVYRGRPIESYDTCFIQGRFANGCRLLFCASHVAQVDHGPVFCYEFEHGTVVFNQKESEAVTAHFTDGSEKVYGCPRSPQEGAAKLLAMLDAAQTGAPPVCGIETVLPHLQVCSAIAASLPVHDFPAELLVRESNPAGVYVNGLYAAMTHFYEAGELPDSQACPWAARSVLVSMQPPV